MNIGGFEQIRNGRGELIGYTRKDPRSAVIHVYNKNSETIGWAKEDDDSGPGYTMMSKGNKRVTQGAHPEYLLAKYNAENTPREHLSSGGNSNPLFSDHGKDGSDPSFR